MTLVPAFRIGLGNAWLFMIIYPLQWLAVVLVPRHIAQKVSHPSDPKQDRKDMIAARATEYLWLGATLYSIFLPMHLGTVHFYVGLGVFGVGLLLLILGTLSVARARPDEPFTKGVYRFSRHPMYLSMVFVYTAVTIAAASWLFLLITVATVFLQRRQMIREEAHCCARFGGAYREYTARTPRWIGVPRS